MRLTRALHQTRRAFSVLASNGPLEFFNKTLNKVQEWFGRPSEQHLRYLRDKAQLDAAFDAERGIDTGGIQRLHDLTIESGNVRFGISHIASDPRVFAAALASIDIAIDGFTFVDLGSGKGRALILALSFPFARIIGVEFARELHEVSVANVARQVQVDPSATRIEAIHGDAGTYAVPNAPLILFLFHPFDSPVIKAVARNALASWRANHRPMRVVYVNPRYLQDWLDAGWNIAAREDYHAILVPTECAKGMQ